MTAPHDITNKRFGRLLVTTRTSTNKFGKAVWNCLCDCGNQKSILAAKLVRGETRSCGCLQSETIKKLRTTHGKSYARSYLIYNSMLQRCNNPNNPSHARYGARGIGVCDRWNKSYEAFLDDMGEPPRGTSLDRIDGSRGYSPENCRWATAKQQSQNSPRPRLITFDGCTRNLSEWARFLGIDESSLHERLACWPLEDALSCGRSHRSQRRKLA